MPEKLDPYRSYGQKVISLFAKLLFTNESYSLTELSRMLGCSKQTVLRLVDDIKRSYGVDVEEYIQERKKFYRLKKLAGSIPALSLTETEISVLQMCKTFTEHLLGSELFYEATRAIEKNIALLPEDKKVSSRHFASFQPGSIDYTPHQLIIRQLIKAMEESIVCRVSYKAIMTDKVKIFYIKPLKIFSYKDTVYLSARMARTPGKRYFEPDFDPLLAIHRISKLEHTDRLFDFPGDYDFDKIFKKNFGVIKDDAFKVEVEFSGWAARFVSERIWSPDQKITKQKNGKVKLKFSASSEPELISWILSFAEEAKVLKPAWLVKELKKTIEKMSWLYV